MMAKGAPVAISQTRSVRSDARGYGQPRAVGGENKPDRDIHVSREGLEQPAGGPVLDPDGPLARAMAIRSASNATMNGLMSLGKTGREFFSVF